MGVIGVLISVHIILHILTSVGLSAATHVPMATQIIRSEKRLPVFKLQGRKNRMEFITDFPGIADHFHVTELIYADTPRPRGGLEDSEMRQAAWDEANKLALELLKSCVTNTVNTIVCKGEGEITARAYYNKLDKLFLRVTARNTVALERGLSKCQRKPFVEDLVDFFGRLDTYFSEFRVAGKPKSQEEMKISAMSSIGDDWAMVAYLVGTPEDVSYDDFQALMLQKEAERMETGSCTGQQLADQLYGRKPSQQNEGAYQTTVHQSWRGSGFVPRGRGRFRGRVFRGGRPGRFGPGRYNMGRQQSNQNERCHNCGQFGHLARQCMARKVNANFIPRSGRGTGKLAEVQCYNCGDYGHISRNCGQRVNAAWQQDYYDQIHGIMGIMKTMKGKCTIMRRSTMIRRENYKLAFKGNI